MYKINTTRRGGSYDDTLIVNGESLHGKIQTRVFRAIVDGKCRQLCGIRAHLIGKDMNHTQAQISSSLQGLKRKGIVKYNFMWLPVKQPAQKGGDC